MQNLMDAIAYVLAEIEDGRETHEVHVNDETFGITYGEENGLQFFVVGWTPLPDGVFAEIDDGTYGTLQGVRVFPDDLEPDLFLRRGA